MKEKLENIRVEEPEAVMQMKRLRSCRAHDIYEIPKVKPTYRDIVLMINKDQVVMPGKKPYEESGKGLIHNAINQKWSEIIDDSHGYDDVTGIEFGWADALDHKLADADFVREDPETQLRHPGSFRIELPDTVRTAAVDESVLKYCLPEEELEEFQQILEAPRIANRYQIQYRLEMLPIEFIVRGYLTGSLLKDYEDGIREFCDTELPDGLQESEKLPEPIFTPRYKGSDGKIGENLTMYEASCIVGKFLPSLMNDDSPDQTDSSGEEQQMRFGIFGLPYMEFFREASLYYYERAADYALQRGKLIIADTKFEYGIDPSASDDPCSIMLGDEILTPESSKYWLAEDYEPGKKMERCTTTREIYSRLFDFPRLGIDNDTTKALKTA